MNSSFFALSSKGKQIDLPTLLFENNKAVGAIAALGVGFLLYLWNSNSGHIKKVRGWPVIGQLAFFTK